MSTRLPVLLLQCALLLLHSWNAHATERPKVAVVLGGGGAHTVAHLGVLKELENQRIPVDLIVGTGAGGLIGGLYSSGMSVEEISALLSGTDWLDVFDPESNREDLSFRRKLDDQDFLVKYKVGVQDGQKKLPTALVSSDKLGWLLQKETASTKGIEKFDDLPIAFRAMAMDLVSGDLVAIDDGPLHRAILATLAAPGTLEPVQIDGRPFVTGSLLNNLPVDVARDWGADVVIVVDAGVFTSPAEDLNSIFAIVDQVGHLLQRNNSRKSIATMQSTDILITPDIDPKAETSFKELGDEVAAGRNATTAAASRLQPLSLGPEAFHQVLTQRSAREIGDPVIIQVKLDNKSRISDEVIRAQIHQPLDAPLDKGQLEVDLRNIFALGAFQSVEFDLIQDQDGSILEVRTIEDKASQKFWRFGINLEDDLQGNSAYTGSASFIWTQINRLNAEWRNIFRIGERQQISTEFYQPVVKSGKWFVVGRGAYVERNVNLFAGDEILSQFRIKSVSAEAGFGRVFGTVSQLQLGLRQGRGDAGTNIGPPMPEAEFDIGGLVADWRYDSFNNLNFPKRGASASLVWLGDRESLGATEDVDLVFGGFSGAKTWGRHSFIGGVDIQTQLKDVPGVQNRVTTGGLFNLSGYPQNSLSGRHTGLVRGIYFQQIENNPMRSLFDASIYLGGSLEYGNAWENSDDVSLSDARLAGSLFLGLDTFIGPVYFAGGLSEGGQAALYLFVGQPF
jgi:NTE family protein